MAITHEDITELKKVFDDRYVLQSDCNEKQEAVNKKFAKDDKRIEIITHDFGVVKKLMYSIFQTVFYKISITDVPAMSGQ